MRILILGAGATGGYFGGRLQEAGADVTFLVRSPRAAKLAANGLRIDSPLGSVTLTAKTVTAETLAQAGIWDLVILSCKAYDLDDSIRTIAPAVGPGTAILPILNGLAHYEALDAAFGREKVLGGLCHIFSTLGTEGEILHMNQLHRLTFGERDGGTSPRTEAFAAICATANFQAIHSTMLMQEAWEKYTLLATLAGMTCLMRANIGTIMATNDGDAIAREMLAECAATATASGHAPRPEPLSMAEGIVTDPKSAMTASMLRDLEGGGRTEGEHIIGDMVTRAKALGVATPQLRVARCHLQAYEIRHARG
ncbi:2-dehydropantoate 2-reductase [Candidatus Terasakiella magnetica]|nr:2-dehydropantoate 2-reductase [Candidatus Terasakiella magnetica]